MTSRKKSVSRKKSGGRQKPSAKSSGGRKILSRVRSDPKTKAIKEVDNVLDTLYQKTDDQFALNTIQTIRDRIKEGDYYVASELLQFIGDEMYVHNLSKDPAWAEKFHDKGEPDRFSGILKQYAPSKMTEIARVESNIIVTIAAYAGAGYADDQNLEEMVKDVLYNLYSKNYTKASEQLDGIGISIDEEFFKNNWDLDSEDFYKLSKALDNAIKTRSLREYEDEYQAYYADARYNQSEPVSYEDYVKYHQEDAEDEED